ncbi:hypothetical protein FOZ63_005131, partial [Perkinsus olseni]
PGAAAKDGRMTSRYPVTAGSQPVAADVGEVLQAVLAPIMESLAGIIARLDAQQGFDEADGDNSSVMTVAAVEDGVVEGLMGPRAKTLVGYPESPLWLKVWWIPELRLWEEYSPPRNPVGSESRALTVSKMLLIKRKTPPWLVGVFLQLPVVPAVRRGLIIVHHTMVGKGPMMEGERG